MSEIPSIRVTDGWGTDRDAKLTDLVIPSSVKMLNVPTKVTFMGTKLSAVPSTATALQEFVAPNVTTLQLNTSANFYNFTHLVSISLPELVTLTDNYGSYNGSFANAALTDVNLPKLRAVSGVYKVQIFKSCTSLLTFSAPLLETINISDGALLYACPGITTLNLPKLKKTIGEAFYGCTGLQTVTLGSDGNPVQSLSSYTFNNCTQPGLTITIYTSGGTALSGSPWGATNATIVYETA